jgi:hypothetical protein
MRLTPGTAAFPDRLHGARGRIASASVAGDQLPPNEMDRLQAAWTKAVILSIAPWSRPYAQEGLW